MSLGVQDSVAGDVDADTSVERDRGREATTSAEYGQGGEAIINPTRGRRNKPKSEGAIAAVERRLEGLELVVGDTEERVEASEQHEDKLEGQVEELEVELVGQVGELKGSIQVVTDPMAWTCVEGLDSCKARVMEVLSTFEEKLDKMRADWALYNGGKRDGKPKEGKPREDLRNRYKPKTNCFLCDGPHWSRDCPKRKALSTMLEEQEDGDKEEVRMESRRQIGSIQAKVDAKALMPQEGALCMVLTVQGTKEGPTLLSGLQLKEGVKEGDEANLAKAHGEKEKRHKEVLPTRREKVLGKHKEETSPSVPKRLPPRHKAATRSPTMTTTERQRTGKPRGDTTARKVAKKWPPRADVAKPQGGKATRKKRKRVGKVRGPPHTDESSGTPTQLQEPRRLRTRQHAWKHRGHRKAVPRRRRDEGVASLGGGE